ncbi:MAG TPA: right-handed parallel beta-helix repeat-containing protein [Candidatus Acidoferrales bacterium]|nr:right-handed parallel beta-helix repeat-containing protein [Candidatus Acidoferrales bacterium]
MPWDEQLLFVDPGLATLEGTGLGKGVEIMMSETKKLPAAGRIRSAMRRAWNRGGTLPAALAICVLSLLFASGASATQREVGSGQTYTTIQACINAAGSGDICNVHAGTYSESVSFKTSGVTLQVNSGDTVVVNGTIDILSNANSIVDGFQVTGFSVTSNGGIHASGTTGGIIRNNVVHDATGSGIYVRQSTNFQVYGNTVHDMNGPCCISDGDGIVIYSASSTDSSYAHGVRVYNNEVYQNHQDGIEISGSYESIYNNYVHDNIYSNFANTHPDGIECNNNVDGITECPHTLIYNNTVKNQNQNIYIDGLGSASADNDIWIFNNVVYNDPTSSTGVSMATGSSSEVILNVGQNAHILNNTIGGVAQYFGLCLGDCTGGGNTSWAFTNVTVENNIFEGSLYYAFWAFPASSVTASNYNDYYNNSQLINWGGTGYSSLSSFASATGQEANGISSNPLLAAFPTPTLQSGSPAGAAGANLTSLGQASLNSDKNGTARPASGAWAMGAYASGSAAPAAPNPPTNVKATAQ